jgi:type II secretory ATPase GspE/PulE/Tfp pilus assembly ATPase PilB-like protein
MILPDEEVKEILIKRGLVDETTWQEAKKDAEKLNLPTIEILLNRKLIDLEFFYNILAEELKVPRAELKGVNIQPSILVLVPEKVAFEKRLVPFALENNVLKVAMVNPRDLEIINLLEEISKHQIEPYLATPQEIQYALVNYQKLYKEEYERLLKSEIPQVVQLTTEANIIRLVDNLLGYALSTNASDIHIEALEEETLVRFRIDGILREIMRLPKSLLDPVIARVKVLSNLPLDEHFRPLDGRLKAVLRVLAGAMKPTSLEELGVNESIEKIIISAIRRTFGMILVTGPTGSGKTTTLYTIINILNNPGVNIVTIEDPIEYAIPGVNQTQVNPKVVLNFAIALRAFLRQDPNIIMVGEIRDSETAEVATHAALTGHLVLSTLHTNDAPTAVSRLVELGVPHYLVADSVVLTMAQRLVRKICLNCIVSEEIAPAQRQIILEQLRHLRLPEEEIKAYEERFPQLVYHGKGCSYCANSGYVGRIGIFEAMIMNDELRYMIASKDLNLEKMKMIARKSGYRTMFEDALDKITVGITTIEEALRVIRE